MHSVEYIELEGFRVAGLAARVRNDQPETIAAHWQRFMADQTFTRMERLDNGAVLSVYTDYESDYTGEYTLLLGYKVATPGTTPNGLRVVDIPGQKYAVLLAQGEQPRAVQDAWQWVWASALQRSYRTDFDEYVSPYDVRLHIGVL